MICSRWWRRRGRRAVGQLCTAHATLRCRLAVARNRLEPQKGQPQSWPSFTYATCKITPIPPAICCKCSTFSYVAGFFGVNFAEYARFSTPTGDLARVSTVISFPATEQRRLTVVFPSPLAAAHQWMLTLQHIKEPEGAICALGSVFTFLGNYGDLFQRFGRKSSPIR
ncbi:hypothetical protein RQP52_21210 [Paenibacillus sp. PFR10]|uniref:Uncharacterized protein n=1 Tax=Paenibacillus violae TaxID=3077234 RepID=A0ABU3RHA2_9BACL|nr:hypothetical protein [Paenibacillus sp. PFR10]